MDVQNPLPHIDVFQRLAFCERICDGIQPARTLPFSGVYARWRGANFDNHMIEFGRVSVSYNGKEPIDFIPSANNENRHQAMALSLFMASIWSNQTAIVESPHEIEGIFRAVFTRVSINCVQYTTKKGQMVRFTFNPAQNSQFA
jgi:hypothetical protein